MASKSVTFRIDENLKEEADKLFGEMGLTMSAALNAFLKATVREQRIPFELTGDELAHKRLIREKLMEAEEYEKRPDAVSMTQDEVFGGFRKKYGYGDV